MADGTHIEWTDATWNPITGCSVVSPGCTNCYAMKLAGTRLKHIPSRKGLTRDTKAGPVWTGEVRLNEEWLDQPLRWKRARKIFVCAHGDLFAENVPDGWIDKVFAVMALSPQHTFQVLTKRAMRMREYVTNPAIVDRIKAAIETHGNGLGDDMDFEFFGRLGWTSRLAPCKPDCERPCRLAWAADRKSTIRAKDYDGEAKGGGICHGQIRWDGPVAWPLANVWLGVSAEDQVRADERIPDLLATPAAVRWVSAEPLLGPIDFKRIMHRDPETFKWLASGAAMLNALTGNYPLEECFTSDPHPDRLHWVIAGGESGNGARPMHPDWARSIRDQCAAAAVPFLFKQWGAFNAVYDRQVEDPDWRRCDIVAGETPNGQWLNLAGGQGFHGERVMRMDRVGKKAAGRLLDGVEHNGFPAAPHGEPVEPRGRP